MSGKTLEEVTAAMRARAATRPTDLLCSALEALDRKAGKDEAERLTRAVLIDTLCERHPQANAAFDAWAADDNSDRTGAVKAITAAARTAAARGGQA